MLFNFKLFPLSELNIEVELLGEKHLSWFHMTYGRYWIDVGDVHLFCYTPAAVETFGSHSSPDDLYVDDYVAWFWRDLLENLPAILEPIPPELAERLSSISAWNDWIDACQHWWSERIDGDDDAEITEEEIEEGEFYNYGLQWWYSRSLWFGQLSAAPNISLWNDGTHIHIAWDNRNRLLNDVPAWEVQVGQIILPKADFITDLFDFERRFITEMAERMKAALDRLSTETTSDIELEVFNLQNEHQQAAALLDQTLRTAESQSPTDWQRVLASLATYPLPYEHST